MRLHSGCGVRGFLIAEIWAGTPPSHPCFPARGPRSSAFRAFCSAHGARSSVIRAFCSVREARSSVDQAFYSAREARSSVVRAFCSVREARSSVARAFCSVHGARNSAVQAFCSAHGARNWVVLVFLPGATKLARLPSFACPLVRYSKKRAARPLSRIARSATPRDNSHFAPRSAACPQESS